MSDFKPRVHDVILGPADAANTPLQSDVWDDEDFEDEDEEDEEEEEEEEEAETAARAAEAESREREERENRLKEWVSRHPGWELARVDGKLLHRKIKPLLKIPPFMRNASRNPRRNLHHGPKKDSSRPRRKISPR